MQQEIEKQTVNFIWLYPKGKFYWALAHHIKKPFAFDKCVNMFSVQQAAALNCARQLDVNCNINTMDSRCFCLLSALFAQIKIVKK